MKVSDIFRIIGMNLKFTYKIHIAWLPKINAILENVLFPSFESIFFILVSLYYNNDPRPISYYIIGSLCFTSINSSIDGVGMLIFAERRFGTLSHTMSSVFHSFWIFFGRVLYWTLIGYVRFLSTLLALYLVFGLDFFSLKTFLMFNVLYFFICLSNSGIGYMLGIIGMIKRSVLGYTQVISLMILLLSGVYFSTDLLPEILQHIGGLIPLTYGIEAARELIANGISDAFIQNLSYMLLTGVFFNVIGLMAYKKFEIDVIKKSKLDVF